MAKIELEIGGKYTAQQAFNTLDKQLKSSSQSAGKVMTQISSGFSSALQQIEGLGPGIQAVTTALNGLGSAGMQGGALVLVALAVQKCIEKFNELKSSALDIAKTAASTVTFAANQMDSRAEKSVLSAKSMLADATLASKEAAGDLQYALQQSNQTYRDKMESALQTKIDVESQAISESAKAVASAEYSLAAAIAKQELLASTRRAKEEAASKKVEAAEAALSLARAEESKVKNRLTVADQRILALQNEYTRMQEQRCQMEADGLVGAIEYIALGDQLKEVNNQLVAAKNAELQMRQTQNQAELDASTKRRQLELDYAQALRDRGTLLSETSGQQQSADQAVVEATARVSEARKADADATARAVQEKEAIVQQEREERAARDKVISLENARAEILNEGNQYQYDASAIVQKYTYAMDNGCFTEEQLAEAKAAALQEVKTNGEAYAYATSIIESLDESQVQARDMLLKYRDALQNGTLAQDEVTSSMNALAELQQQTLEDKKNGRTAGAAAANAMVSIPQPLETHDKDVRQKADDMIDLTRIDNNDKRRARDILTSIKNQGPQLRKFLRDELPPSQKKVMAQFLTERYKELEEKLGPAEAKKEMHKLLVEVGQRELLSSAVQKKEVRNNLAIFEGLKSSKTAIEQREKKKVQLLKDISEKLQPKAK